MSDIVEIQINGTKFSGWESLTITRAIDNVAGAFSMAAPFDPENSQVADAFRPFGYQDAKILIDGEKILTGRIEQVAASVQAADRAINIQGRSLTGSLVDGAVDIGKFQFEGLTLGQIARQIVDPFGLSVVIENDTAVIEEARCEPGQTGFEFLNALAQDNGLLLRTDPDGRLVISKINTRQTPAAAIVEGSGPVLEVSGDYNGSGRWSNYKVYGQQDAATAAGEAADPGVRIYRPRIETGAESDASKIGDAAKWRRALALAAAVSVGVKLTGWRDAVGRLWDAGRLVTLQAPGAYIIKETPFIIAEAALTLDASEGKTTALRLVLPGTYSGEMPGEVPWE